MALACGPSPEVFVQACKVRRLLQLQQAALVTLKALSASSRALQLQRHELDIVPALVRATARLAVLPLQIDYLAVFPEEQVAQRANLSHHLVMLFIFDVLLRLQALQCLIQLVSRFIELEDELRVVGLGFDQTFLHGQLGSRGFVAVRRAFPRQRGRLLLLLAETLLQAVHLVFEHVVFSEHFEVLSILSFKLPLHQVQFLSQFCHLRVLLL